MSNSGNRKPPLVADKRYAKPKPAPKKAAKPAKRKPPPRKAPKKRGIIGWLLTPFRVLFRMIWGLTWRIGAVALLILAAAVAYTYTTLPELEDLLDGRTRGSVTLLDSEGVVFA